MRKISKDKRNQVILVAMLTTMGVVGIWFGLINFQHEQLRKLEDRKAIVKSRLTQIEQALESETGRNRGPCQRKRKRNDIRNDQVNIGVETGRQPRRGLQRRRRLPGIGVDHSNEEIAGRLGTMWGEYLKIRDECRTHTSDTMENS